MNRLWNWLERNSSQLQGLAAVAAILASLAAVPFLMSKWLQPEVTIKITAESPTMPPALEEWISEATRILKHLPRVPKDDPDPYQSLRKLQATGPLDPIRDGMSWRLSQPGRLRVEIANQADRVIPGVRLRLEHAYPVWGITLAATFLTAEEVTVWKKGLAAENAGPAMVLPELPPIPPRSAVVITAFGDVADVVVSAAVPGTSFKLIQTVRVEDKGPIALVLRPYWLPLPVGLVALAVLAGFAIFEKAIWRRARRYITYNLACEEAKAGRKEGAVALLQEAVDAGYSNLRHMQNDPDLQELREIDDFKKLVGS